MDERMDEEQVEQHIVIAHEGLQRNGIGTAGFVVAMVDLVFCWAPVLNVLLWLVGLVLSAIGLFRKPKGLAIAGYCISILNLALIVFIIKGIMGWLLE